MAVLKEAALILRETLQHGNTKKGVFSSADITDKKMLESVGGLTVPLFLQAVLGNTDAHLNQCGMQVDDVIKKATEDGDTTWLWRRALFHAQHLKRSVDHDKGEAPPLLTALAVSLRHRGVDGGTHKLLTDLGITVDAEVAKSLTYTWAGDPDVSPERLLVDALKQNPDAVADYVVSVPFLAFCVLRFAFCVLRFAFCVCVGIAAPAAPAGVTEQVRPLTNISFSC
jgi:hypothetical protein